MAFAVTEKVGEFVVKCCGLATLGFCIPKGDLKGSPWKGAPYLKKLGRLREPCWKLREV